MKLSQSPLMRRLIDEQKERVAIVEGLGFEYLPCVNGPYIYCPKTKRTIASYGSEEFNRIVSKTAESESEKCLIQTQKPQQMPSTIHSGDTTKNGQIEMWSLSGTATNG